MRCDILLKTWWGDLCWASYAIRFLQRNWREKSRIIVLANADCRPVIETWGFGSQLRYFYVHPWRDSNQFQVYLTLLADEFSDAELFAIFDSDTMLLEPMELSDRMENGKPIIYYLPYTEEPTVAQHMWAPIMEYWLGVKPSADYMQRFPFIYRASTIAAVRRLITQRRGYPVLDSLYSDTPYSPATFFQHPFRFCEHNVISFYAQLFEPDQYIFRDVHQMERYPVRQYHSWTDWSPDRQAEFDRLLADPKAMKRIVTKGWTVLAGDAPEGHSTLVINQGRMDVDPSGKAQEFIRPYLKPGSVAIDVGAHIGNFAIPMARALGSSGKVIAFEPAPEPFECLKANAEKEMAANGSVSLTVIPYAVGAKSQKGKLCLNPSNYAGASLLNNLFGDAAAIEVDVVALDDTIDPSFQERVSFIKIDVEGGELGVIQGAEKLLRKYHPALFIEIRDHAFVAAGTTTEDFYAYLRQLGYSNFTAFPQEWVDAGHPPHDMLIT